MKTILKQMVVISMLVLFFSPAHAQPQNELLLPYLLPDSLEAKAQVNNKPEVIVPLQATIKNYVDEYLDENGETLAIIKERNTARLKAIQKILIKRGVPAELMYLALVESELKNTATSKAGAVGIWQLMPETARTFGLEVSYKHDQRRHVNRSTAAAADYLNALYKQFDDWLLVVAAYNCGAGNVFKAIKQSGSREFWKLQRFLPAESRAHVKHFIATHFYYEAGGSVVTLTKKERLQHLASLNVTDTQNPEQATGTAAPAIPAQPVNGPLLAQQEGELLLRRR